MNVEWTNFKSEINKLVEDLKSKLHSEFKIDCEKKDIFVSTKIKDNAKEATVKIINKNKPAAESELQLGLNNTQNLAKRFDSILADFKTKNS